MLRRFYFERSTNHGSLLANAVQSFVLEYFRENHIPFDLDPLNWPKKGALITFLRVITELRRASIEKGSIVTEMTYDRRVT